MPIENLYLFFGVPADATLSEIKERYRFLCHAYHPDKFSTEDQRRVAEKEFKQINEVYQTLSDPVKRAQYNESRRESSASASDAAQPHSQTTSHSVGASKVFWRRGLTRIYFILVAVWFCYWLIWVPFQVADSILNQQVKHALIGLPEPANQAHAPIVESYRSVFEDFIKNPGLTFAIFILVPLAGYVVFKFLLAVGSLILKGFKPDR